MSPILVRPVREQLEHDRIIRLLQTKFRRQVRGRHQPRRRADLAGRRRAVAPSSRTWCSRPWSGAAGSRRSSRSKPANRSTISKRSPQWTHFSRLRAAFHLYVPAGHGGRRAAAGRREPGPRQRDSGAITRSATRSGSRSSTGAANGPARARPRRRAGGEGPSRRRRVPRPRRTPPRPRASPPRAARRARRVRLARRRPPGRRSANDGRRRRRRTPILARQAGLRALLPRSPVEQSPRALAVAPAVLVPHAAGREGRPFAVRRRHAPGARGALSRHRLRLEDAERDARCRRRPKRRSGASAGGPNAPPGASAAQNRRRSRSRRRNEADAPPSRRIRRRAAGRTRPAGRWTAAASAPTASAGGRSRLMRRARAAPPPPRPRRPGQAPDAAAAPPASAAPERTAADRLQPDTD